MSSSILHQCPQCGHVDPLFPSPTGCKTDCVSTKCGLSASESNQKVQDELASLFERQMSMTQYPVTDSVGLSEYPNSVEQHYQSPQLDQVQSPHSSVDVLRFHGLDPYSLTASQLELFENADAEQRERLIQTWQLYSQIGNTDQSKDFAMEDSSMDVGDENTSAEPYMVSGYENSSLPKEPTTGESYSVSKDPVYQSQEWWEMTKAGPIESGYGAFQEMRRYYPSCGVYRC
ncbi:unnamed protein product [Penicillium bialowiezense]